MSHIERLKLNISDLAALQAAAPLCGLKLEMGAQSFKWYEGRGECDHKLTLEHPREGSYEIGLRQRKDGSGYDLLCDLFDRDISRAVGGSLECGRLKQAYGATLAEQYYQGLGYETFQTRDETGNVIVQAVKQ